MLVSLSDSPETKECDALAILGKKRKQHFSPREYYKETLSGLTFATRNGTVHVLFRSRFQSPGEAFLITVYLDRHSLSQGKKNRATTQPLRHADFPSLPIL